MRRQAPRPKYQPAWYPSPISLPERTIGKFSVQHRTVMEKTPVIGMRQAYTRGLRPVTAKLSEPLHIHELVEKGHGLWMTDLPEELNQIGEMLYHVQPQDKVLVGGLGLGIVATTVSRLPQVTETVVVEKSKAVIKLCGPENYAEETYLTAHADILQFLQDFPKPFDYYLLDTWCGNNELTWWGTVLPLRRTIRQHWGVVPVVHCWAEDIMWGQVKRRLCNLTKKDAHWYYAPEFCGMSEPEAEQFQQDAGLKDWEKRYGPILDRVVKKMSGR